MLELGGKLASVLEIPGTLGHNLGADCAHGSEPEASSPYCWAFDSSFTFQPGKHPEFHDLQVLTQGTKPKAMPLEGEPDDSPIAPFSITRRYQFRDGAYVERP